MNCGKIFRHRQKRIGLLAVLLCGALLLGGCDKTVQESPQSATPPAQQQQAATADTLTLAYTANDSLNPYLAKTKTNQELACLLYDSLVVLEDQFTPTYRLAKEITMKGKLVTITLQEAYFSDGSRVTAEDVLFSMERAMTAETMSYARDFAVVTKKSAAGVGVVELTLAYEDPYFVNFLDFPVYKKGSEDEENTDNKDLPPIGSGRYIYHEESGDYWLTANENWIGGQVKMKTVMLLNLPDDDAIDHAIQVGTVDWCYSDLQDNAFPKMKGVSKNVPLNNLVYLGCNIESGFMSIREIRMGVSVALDRTDLVENAYFGVATPAAGPFPTGLEEADGFQSISPKADKESAEAYFKTAGFTRLGEENYYSNGNDTLTLRLVYNKENTARESVARLVSTRLKTAGCKVTVEPLTFEQYQSAIQHGYYDLYVGEMRLPDNLNLYPLLTAGGLISYPASVLEKEPDLSGETTQGADTSFEVEEDAVDGFTALRAAYRYQKGEGSLTETLSCINDQLPIIPICHRQGMLIYASFISGEPTPTHGDPFHGIENCTIQ